MNKMFKQFLLGSTLLVASFECEGKPPFLSPKLTDDNPVWDSLYGKLRPHGFKKAQSPYKKDGGSNLGSGRIVVKFGDNPSQSHAHFIKGDLAYLLGRIESARGKEHAHACGSDTITLDREKDMIDIGIGFGSRSAMKYRLMGLARGQNGYQKRKDVAAAFNDYLIENFEDPFAMEKKLTGLLGKESDLYKENSRSPEISRISDIQFSGRSSFLAIKCMIEGLAYGKYGYKRGTKEVVCELVDQLFTERDLFAIEFKLESLSTKNRQEVFYDYNPELARTLNEQLIEEGNKEAVVRKLKGLHDGIYGYSKSIQEEFAYNDSLVEKGDPEAIWRKVYCMTYGYGDLKPDPVAARPWADKLLALGDKRGVRVKLGNGSLKDNAARAAFLSNLREQNEKGLSSPELREKAIRRKLNGLLGKSRASAYGYERNLEAARQFNEELITKGDLRAVRRKIKGLTDGTYGYTQNLDAAENLLANTFYVPLKNAKYENLSEDEQPASNSSSSIESQVAEVKAQYSRANTGDSAAQLIFESTIEDDEKMSLLIDGFISLAGTGDRDAQWILARYYDLKRDMNNAITWYLPLAEQKIAKAQYNLARCCEINGDSVNATKWYLLAAASGDERAQNKMGTRFLREWSHTKNPEILIEAEKMFRAAAALGSADATLNLAGILQRAGETEEANAFYLQVDPAKVSEPEGQYRLGLALEKLNATEKAKQSYIEAARQGHKKAHAALEKLTGVTVLFTPAGELLLVAKK